MPFSTAEETSGDLLIANKTKGGKLYELTFDVRDGDAGEGLAPVNIVTDIRETGDTNAFLQALAAGFGRARPALGMALE